MSEDRHSEVRLIRHGETRGYHADLGLTGRGRAQSLAKGAQLAAGPGPVRLLHAPTARATETAAALAEGLLSTNGTLAITGPSVDARFDNFRLWCDEEALDPTQAYAAYASIRDGGGERPGWFAEIDRFFTIQAAGDDPITYWLTQPVQHFEPAAVAVRRFWHGIVAHAEPGLRVFVATHSGCIRAVAAAAFGHDPGEPENTEDVLIRIRAGRAELTYRGRTVELVVPTTVTAPWHEGEPQHAHR
ncbi:histidine phosphatase family protein [Amycolatopsis alkalitolerans]|uniref:Histidine phosphatase family protein n=1 Tax=Amycolatopsis alkalitolerans TaxID=2547244 RepID=A0A5C4LZD8_9PSEU|nr:histidine phosphatase family protein [Amycolatopsis alkalitolerans]TNC25174.1 hypothetical protein FG385_16150 [Amycolatopsis alkalitolerans]